MAKDKDSNLRIRPLDDRVVVEPLEAEEKTSGGIVLPDSAKQKPQRGRVLAIGPGKLRDTGERNSLNVSKGDEVLGFAALHQVSAAPVRGCLVGGTDDIDQCNESAVRAGIALVALGS